MSDLVARALAAAHERTRLGARAELRARGVVATPAELARHGVARVDQLLRDQLGIVEGLASERVVIVDPAVGTGVWLAAVLEHTRRRGARSSILGFDTDRATLERVEELLRGEITEQGARLQLSCANTLELAAPFPNEQAVRVILGNPPWAARSLSRGGALSDAWLAEFRFDHEGAPLAERRSGVLSDDYVRFFRWSLEQARHGQSGAVLCLATNGSFLDGTVHRGMRAALVKGFDRIETIDLGGNSLLSQKQTAVRERDDNVFGVRVGAAITWAVRHPRDAQTPGQTGRVSFSALRGSVSDKLLALATSATPLTEHAPAAPWFRFRPGVASTARAGFSIAAAFPFQREGVQTNRDAIAIAATRAELEQRVHDLAHGVLVVPALPHFDPGRAQRTLQQALERGDAYLAPLAYRPLDDRFVVALAPLCHRPRSELQAAVKHSRICLLAVRKDRGAAPFNLFAAAEHVADACFLSTRSSCRTRVFPSHQPDGSPNISQAIAGPLADRIGRLPTPEELIAYGLSVLGSPRFRRAQQAALQQDYAALPWPRDSAQFDAAVEVGSAFLRALSAARPPAALQLERVAAVDPHAPLSDLRYEPSTSSVLSAGEVLLRGVEPALWGAQVGHQSLVLSALRAGAGCDLTRLLHALARAAAWVAAEAAADVLVLQSGEP